MGDKSVCPWNQECLINKLSHENKHTMHGRLFSVPWQRHVLKQKSPVSLYVEKTRILYLMSVLFLDG